MLFEDCSDLLLLGKENKILWLQVYFHFIYRPARILSFYGHKPKITDIKFAIKCIFKTNGVVLNVFLFFFATFILSLISEALFSP